MKIITVLFFTLFFFFNINSSFADSENICKKIGVIAYPEMDKPTTEDKKNLGSDGDEWSYYYGIDNPVDYIKARKTAFMDLNPNLTINGHMVLIMIYANGYGVKRNIDLAISVACQNINGSTKDKVITHLESLRTTPDKIFDICKFPETEQQAHIFENLKAHQVMTQTDTTLNKLIAKWPSKHQTAFKELNKNAEDFFEKHSKNETQQGTGSYAETNELQEKTTLQKKFFTQLFDFEQGKLPNFSEKDFHESETKINELYVAFMKKAHSMTGREDGDGYFYGTPCTSSCGEKEVTATQKIWLTYRDAWVKFGAIHYPQIPAYAWKTWASKQRIEQLQNDINGIY